MSKESLEWYKKTNEIANSLPQTKYPKMKKASNRRLFCNLYCNPRNKNAWQISGKPYGKAQNYLEDYSGWHNIIHALAHRIIRLHTPEHSVLEYKLCKFVKEWGYAEKHQKLIKGEK